MSDKTIHPRERDMYRERDELHARLAESEAENDQWQKKLAETWAEVEQLRQKAAGLDVEHEIQRQMLARLGIEWTPGEPFYSLIEAEIARLRAEGLKLAAQSSAESVMLEEKVERLRALLRRLYEWDHMDSSSDGPFWRGEIDKALGRSKL
jgi:uncharacterized coiled-coil DUF342 family protein